MTVAVHPHKWEKHRNELMLSLFQLFFPLSLLLEMFYIIGNTHMEQGFFCLQKKTNWDYAIMQCRSMRDEIHLPKLILVGPRKNRTSSVLNSAVSQNEFDFPQFKKIYQRNKQSTSSPLKSLISFLISHEWSIWERLGWRQSK